MGELGVVVRYAYWSDRRVRSIADQNGIAMDRRFSWAFKSPAIPAVPTIEANADRRSRTRAEMAHRIERTIGDAAVTDFVTPPPVHFAKGIGNVVFSHFVGGYTLNNAILAHTTVKSSDGSSVDVCLFGSAENMADYAGRKDKTTEGWTSSAAPAIEELLRTRGTVNTSQWDDRESLSVEAMKIGRYQGITEESEGQGKPWTRGFTLGHSDEAEWFAEIYTDVILDKSRWSLEEKVDRILVGAPLWVRTPLRSFTRYRDLRK